MSSHFNPQKVWQSSRKKNLQKTGKRKVDFKKNRNNNGFTFASITGWFTKPKREVQRPRLSQKKRKSDRDIVGEIKVFKPKEEVLETQSGQTKVKVQSSLPKIRIPGTKKTFSFGFKSIATLRERAQSFEFKNIWYQINYWLMKFRVFERINIVIVSAISGAFLISLVYFTFFDTYFLVKNYTVTFSEGSYLNEDRVRMLLSEVRSDKFLGFIPNNQFWFLNDRNITAAAQNEFDEVEEIRVTRRFWPNEAIIEITTEPVLLTLAVNNEEYWRIAQDGEVIGLDDAGLRQNLVVVDRLVAYNRPNATLQDYSFARDCPNVNEIEESSQCEQLNRFWFVLWLWELLDFLEVDYTKTTFPSLFDTDVIITARGGGELYFNSQVMSKETQSDRIRAVLESIVGSQLLKGEIRYIDFRIPKKVYICRVGRECEQTITSGND